MSFHFYQFQHKAIRNFFGEINVLCGSTNFKNISEVETLRGRFLKLMALLASHSFLEEQVILPALQKKEIVYSDKDSHDHGKLDHKIFQIIGQIQQLVAISEDSQKKGDKLYLLFTEFHAEYLFHMIHEETETWPLLLEHLTPNELADLQTAISNKIPPQIMKDWLTHGLPAINHLERIQLLRPLILDSSTEKLSSTLSVVKRVLHEDHFRTLMEALHLKFV